MEPVRTQGKGDKFVIGVPRYIIDLDLTPKQRWKQVAQDYMHYFPIVKRTVQEMFGSFVECIESDRSFFNRFFLINVAVASKLFEWAHSLGWVAYREELKAIASYGNISVGLLVLMQLVYEASAACTSIVIRDSNV